MVSNSNFQCIQSSNSSNLKPSNSQILKVRKCQTFELHVSQSFKFSTFENFKSSTPQSLKLFELSIFEPFELSSFQTPWVSKIQTPRFQTFELEPEGRSVNLYAFSSSPPSRNALPRLQTSKLDSHSNFQTSTSRSFFKLETLKLLNFKLFIFQTFPISKLSNLVQQKIRSNSQKFEFEKPPLVTPLQDKCSISQQNKCSAGQDKCSVSHQNNCSPGQDKCSISHQNK